MLDRREFIRTGVLGLAGLTLGPKLAYATDLFGFETTQADQFNLAIDEALVQMVNEEWVYMWTFEDEAEGAPRFPGPVLIVREGEEITMGVRNRLDENHSFYIPGVVDSGPIAPNDLAAFTFTAPAAGIYPYYDNLNAPVNRMVGLHGAFMVMPAPGSVSPYSNPTPAVAQLFADLGTTDHFPGHPWHHDRITIWVLSAVDPSFNAIIEAGDTIAPIAMQNFIGRYFFINGKSGYFAAHDPGTMLHGHIGQPMLVRVVNHSLHPHFPHAHGNHKYPVARNGQPLDNVLTLDVLKLRPLETVDFVYPFTIPPDIPPGLWPPQEEPLPLMYPMHCHNEPSQTAAGSNYPQGMMTEIMFHEEGAEITTEGTVTD